MLKLPKRLTIGGSKSHARARSQEKEIAKRVGGRTTKQSGAGPEKGDARLGGVMRIECKTTKHSSFRVTTDMINRIEDAACSAGEIPVLCVELEGGKRKVTIIPDWALADLVHAAKKQ